MKAVRCPNGHWFDSESYDKCPHCGQNVEKNETKTSEIKPDKPQKKGLSSIFKKNRGNEKEQPQNIKETPIASYEISKKSQTSNTSDDVTERFFADIDDEKTVSMFENSNDLVGQSEASSSSLPYTEVDGTVKKVISEPLSDAVQRVSAMEDGKTLSYFNAMTTQKNTTDGLNETPNAQDPVVGWLVCIGGLHTGEAFQLHVGKNAIGRSDSNKVVLRLDRSISRENHATVIYEPKKREFYLQTGNTDGLIYLNENFVDGSQLIKTKDVLEMGTSKFIFVPLCGEDFSWEQYI